MILIYTVMLIALVTIIGVLVWFALQDQDLNCTNNGCTKPQDEPDNSNWPFPRRQP